VKGVAAKAVAVQVVSTIVATNNNQIFGVPYTGELASAAKRVPPYSGDLVSQNLKIFFFSYTGLLIGYYFGRIIELPPWSTWLFAGIYFAVAAIRIALKPPKKGP
jgi:hypothetical protein